MKLILILWVLVAGCSRYSPPPQREVTIQYILRNDDGSGEVWARYQSPRYHTLKLYYMASFTGGIPDSLVVGKVLKLSYNDGMVDSCKCVVFNQMNKTK